MGSLGYSSHGLQQSIFAQRQYGHYIRRRFSLDGEFVKSDPFTLTEFSDGVRNTESRFTVQTRNWMNYTFFIRRYCS